MIGSRPYKNGAIIAPEICKGAVNASSPTLDTNRETAAGGNTLIKTD